MRSIADRVLQSVPSHHLHLLYQEKQNVSNCFLLFVISNEKKKELKAAVNLIFQDRVFHKLEENNILAGNIDIRVNLGAKLFSGSNLNFGCPLGYVHAIPDSFSCRHEKGIRYSRNTDPICNSPLKIGTKNKYSRL